MFYHLCARLISPHASTDVILVPKIKTFAARDMIHVLNFVDRKSMTAAPLASVVEVDIEASKDVDKELLTRGNIDNYKLLTST